MGTPSPGIEALSAELEQMALRELRETWEYLNWSHFRNVMRAPTLMLSDSSAELAHWEAATRTIALSRRLVLEHPWSSVTEVLKHEMAHQFVNEALSINHEPPHGPMFQRVCADRGIDPRGHGLPEASGGSDADLRIVERVSRLLSLASSPNQHEAEAATVAARRLMLKHNIDAASAPKAYGFKHLGEPARRIEESARIVARLLEEHFFVDTIWTTVYLPQLGKRATVLEICGTPANLAIAEYVHAYLGHAGNELWRAHREANGIPGHRQRRTFIAGVMDGFRQKLAREAAQPQEPGLIWVGDPGLRDYYQKRHPRVRRIVRGGHARDDAFRSGQEAGQRLVLRRAVEGAPVARGRLLGPGGDTGS